VHGAARDVHRQFRRVHRLIGQALSLLKHTEHQRSLTELREEVERRMERCRKMGG
jgi:hypothetical protein